MTQRNRRSTPHPARCSVSFLFAVLFALAGAPRAEAAPLAHSLRPDSTRAAAERYAGRYRIPLQLARTILEAAQAEGLDPELGFRLVRVESVFKTNARGAGGALGLVQLMPGTARSIDRALRTEEEILKPETNLRVGFRYLRQMIRRYEGDVRLGLLAYNRGETVVDRALKRGADPENGYSHKVLGTRTGITGTPYKGSGIVPKR
ncbi:MAG: transglycosylase SLT domain-containing protein [Gemmatimonadota bacterium]|nr:transglycosylase SLT domain-containing protein [Gemmatimonadota bacterium]